MIHRYSGQLTLVTALGLVGTDYQLKGIFPVYPATQVNY